MLGEGTSGFRGKLEHFLYSGDKKHVMAGIAIISVVFCAPWFFMSRDVNPCLKRSGDLADCTHLIGTLTSDPHIGYCLLSAVLLCGSKHQSHQDYMEKADKARQARLSAK